MSLGGTVRTQPAQGPAHSPDPPRRAVPGRFRPKSVAHAVLLPGHMTKASATYPLAAKWWIGRAIDAFCGALRRQATARGWRRNTAPKTVWNFDHDSPAPAQLVFVTKEQKTKNSF